MSHRLRVAIGALFCLSSAFVASVANAQPEADRLVQRILERAKINFQVDATGDFRATYDIGEGRSQLVIIRSGLDQIGELDSREIRSIGYRAPSDPFPAVAASRLLDENNRRVLGKWGKQGTLAVLSVRVPPAADADVLMAAIEMAARDADAMEKTLAPERDEF